MHTLHDLRSKVKVTGLSASCALYGFSLVVRIVRTVRLILRTDDFCH